jgi:hypothetical protein
MADKKIKISFRPEGPDFIWEHFMDHIIDPLVESGLLEFHTAPTTHHVSSISVFQGGKWTRENLGQVGRTLLAEFAQSRGLPMIIEDGEIFYVMDEKDAVVEYLKHGR